MKPFLFAAIILLFAGALVGEVQAQDSAQNDVNNPLTPKITVNFQDYFVPSLDGLPDSKANQFLFRGLIPANLFGEPQLFRFTLPLATEPLFPTGSVTGLGDLTLMDLFIFPGKPITFAAGPIFVAPTGTSDATGQGRWQAGAAGVGIIPQSWGILGGLVTYQNSFAASNHRDPVKTVTVQPLAFYNLPDGFYLRSSAIWNFDAEHGSGYIPLGFGVGKAWEASDTLTVNFFLEPQYTVWHEGPGAPRWQIFAGITLQFVVGK